MLPTSAKLNQTTSLLSPTLLNNSINNGHIYTPNCTVKLNFTWSLEIMTRECFVQGPFSTALSRTMNAMSSRYWALFSPNKPFTISIQTQWMDWRCRAIQNEAVSVNCSHAEDCREIIKQFNRSICGWSVFLFDDVCL